MMRTPQIWAIFPGGLAVRIGFDDTEEEALASARHLMARNGGVRVARVWRDADLFAPAGWVVLDADTEQPAEYAIRPNHDGTQGRVVALEERSAPA